MPSPIIKLNEENKQNIASFVDAMRDYDIMASRIETLNIDRERPEVDEMYRLIRVRNEAVGSAAALREILTSSRQEIEDYGWERVIPYLRESLQPTVLNERTLDRFLAFIESSGGAQAMCEAAISEWSDIESDLAVRTSNIQEGSPNNSMSARACLMTSVAGILGTLAGCLPCGVGAIGAAGIGGCM